MQDKEISETVCNEDVSSEIVIESCGNLDAEVIVAHPAADAPTSAREVIETNEGQENLTTTTDKAFEKVSRLVNDTNEENVEISASVEPTEALGNNTNESSLIDGSEPVQADDHTHEAEIQNFIQGSVQGEKVDAYSDDELMVDGDGDGDGDPDTESESSSSDSGSSGESSDSSDFESNTQDGEDDNNKLMIDELDEEDEAITGPILSKNEVADEKAMALPADYTVPEKAPLEYIGNITALVENSVIIKANVSGEFRILKDDSILCFEDRQLLGPLFETFGRLQAPNYRVKFNTDEEFQKMKDKKGSKVFYVVPDSQFVYTDSIKKIKGTDASNCHDEELPEDEQEYSDDEQELAAKQAKNRKRKQKKQESNDAAPRKKAETATAEKSFLSYGFAARKPEQPPQDSQTQYQQVHHHNPALHGTSHPYSVPNTSTYGVPYGQLHNNIHGQGVPPQASQGNVQMHQPYIPPQAYVTGPQYGQYPQSYLNSYGVPYNPLFHSPVPQMLQSQNIPHSAHFQLLQVNNVLAYSQNFPIQASHQVYLQPQDRSSIHPLLPPMPPQPHSQHQTHIQEQHIPQPHVQVPQLSNEALQQLQQMVSQNLTKVKEEEKS